MKLIVTVVGKDQVGIIAKVSTALAQLKVNILDISQTILGDKFTMMMYVDIDEKLTGISDLKAEMASLEKEIHLAIQVYSEEIFNYMHKI